MSLPFVCRLREIENTTFDLKAEEERCEKAMEQVRENKSHDSTVSAWLSLISVTQVALVSHTHPTGLNPNQLSV